MTDSLIPDWVKDREKSQQSRQADAIAAAKDADLSEVIIRADGPVFWKQLLKDLYVNVSSLPRIGIRASLIDLDGRHPASAMRIYLIHESHSPSETYADVFYESPGVDKIRCVPQEGDAYTLKFGVWKGNKLLVSNGGAPMNPEQAAEYIVKPLVDQLGA